MSESRQRSCQRTEFKALSAFDVQPKILADLSFKQANVRACINLRGAVDGCLASPQNSFDGDAALERIVMLPLVETKLKGHSQTPT